MAVTNNLTTIHSFEATTDAVTSAVISGTSGGAFLGGAGEFIEGTLGYGFDLDIETHTTIVTPTASLNLSGQSVWVWVNFLTLSYMGTWANGAFSCTLSDGTNTSTWYLGGSERPAAGFARYVFSTGSTPDAVSGTLNLSAVTIITFSTTGIAKSKLAENVFFDFLQYGADGVGISVTGGTVGTPETFADVALDDATAAAGLFSLNDGVYFLNGSVKFGDDVGVAATYFKDSNQQIASKSHYRTFTTANRGTAESLVSATHNTITVAGNATGVTSFVSGLKTGDLGYAGNTIKTGGNRLIVVTCTDVNVDTFQVYGSNFINCGVISLPTVSGTAREVLSSNFNSCAQLVPSTAVFENNILAATTDANGAMLGNRDLTDNIFISDGTGHAIYVTAIGTYAYAGLNVSGYGADATTDAVIYNNSGGLVTINASNIAGTLTVLNGAGASTVINNNITLTFTPLIAGSDVSVFLAGTTTPIQSTDSSGTSFPASVPASTSLDYKIYKPGYEVVEVYGVSFAASQDVLIGQQVNRNWRPLEDES